MDEFIISLSMGLSCLILHHRSYCTNCTGILNEVLKVSIFFSLLLTTKTAYFNFHQLYSTISSLLFFLVHPFSQFFLLHGHIFAKLNL